MDVGKEFRSYATKHRRIPSSNIHRYANHMMATPQAMTRSIIEERERNFREIDVFSRLMADRNIFLGMQVNVDIANIIVAQLLFLQSTSSQEVNLYINSPGGSVHAGYSIRDTMNLVTPEIKTINYGMAASMGAILLTSGAKGKRFVLPYSRTMIHQPLGGMEGQSTDMEISMKQMIIIRDELYQIIQDSLPAGKERTMEQITKDCDRDNWFKADEAIEYGLADEKVLSGK